MKKDKATKVYPSRRNKTQFGLLIDPDLAETFKKAAKDRNVTINDFAAKAFQAFLDDLIPLAELPTPPLTRTERAKRKGVERYG